MPASSPRRRQSSWKVETVSRPEAMAGASSGRSATHRASGWLKQTKRTAKPSAASRRAFSIASRVLPLPAPPSMLARRRPWRVRRSWSWWWVGARSSRSPASRSPRRRGRRRTSGSSAPAMTARWCSARGRSREPSADQKAKTRSRAWAAAPGSARSTRSRTSSAGASGPRVAPSARDARSTSGKATAWRTRGSGPVQPGWEQTRSRMACFPVSAWRKGDSFSSRVPAYQRPKRSRSTRPSLTSMARRPRAGSTRRASISPSRGGLPGCVGASQRTFG